MSEEDQFRPSGVTEKEAPLQPRATSPGILHLGGDTAPPACVDPLQIPATDSDSMDASGDLEMVIPSAIPVGEGGRNQRMEQYAVPVQDQKTAAPRKIPLTYILVGAVLLAAVVTVAGVCGSGHCSSSNDDDETTTSFRDIQGTEIQTQLEAVFGSSYFDSTTPTAVQEPHTKALQWIIHADDQQLDPEDPNLLQRFFLALFYFATTRHKPWTDCNPPATGQPDQCYYTVYGSYEQRGERWLSGGTECHWAGVECADSKLETIRQWGNGLNGYLPSEIAMLSRLTTIDLHNNQLTGTLPSSLYDMAHLQYFSVGGNHLTGTLAPELFTGLRGIINFRVRDNSLSGTLPTEVGLTPARILTLGINNLSGTIPAEMFAAQNLAAILLDETQLTGTIPTEIGLLGQHDSNKLDLNISVVEEREDGGPQFETILLGGNPGLSGTLPSELGLIKGLGDLGVDGSMLEGTIPKELLTGCTQLHYLNLGNCRLSGTLDTNFGLLSQLHELNLENNDFVGSIPDELSALTNLLHFSVNGNRLTGSIPDGICFDNTFNAQGFDVVADCLPTTNTSSSGVAVVSGEPAVVCPAGCCSTCCDAGTGICLPQ